MEKILFLCLPLTLSFMLSLLYSVATAKTSISTDQSALLSVKSHMSFVPGHMLEGNWTAESSVCDWIGVTCGSRHFRVRKLNVSHMGLGGTIPPQLGNISFLVSLDLRGNSFHGNLPQELTRLHRLKLLDLNFNTLTGEIPSWVDHLNQLEYLYLYGNNFTGSIPTSVSNMSNLKDLFFGGNQLSGSVPFEIFNISTLEMINLQYNGLSGDLPDDICRRLPRLKILSLAGNRLSGPLPSAWSQCLQLQQIYLGDNSFSGLMPKELCNLKALMGLHLERNKLQGIIPEEIGNLTNLRQLTLHYNYLTGGIPKEIGNLTTLVVLNLDMNHLRGAIPLEMGNLDNLEELYLNNNSFSGSIPEGIFNISAMWTIALDDNYLSGKLPSTAGFGLPNLENLYLAENQFSGVIPPSLSNSSRLRLLELSANQFTGTIPASFGNLRSLEVLDLQANKLSRGSSALEMDFLTSLSNCNLTFLGLKGNPLNGVLPKSIGNLSATIEKLYMDGCGLLGGIPDELGNLTTLTLLALQVNQLSGLVPKSIISIQNLQQLSFAQNRLSGHVSNYLCGSQTLGYLDLSENMFSGPLPECISNLTSLRILYLDGNKFTSTIPNNLWNLKDLLELNLSSNSLSGVLPPQVGNLKVISLLDLSMNNLTGDLPTTIGSLQNLQFFSLADNLLQGDVPDSFGNMLSVQTLDLSHNKISGIIPLSLENLTYLENFNVSYNDLTGRIPSEGPFKNFSSGSFIFNKALCGEQKFHVPPCPNLSPKRSWANGLRHILILSFSILGFIVAVALGVVYLIYRKKDTVSIKEEFSPWTRRKRISYYELQQATQRYDETNLLGQGSFGSVYKGTLGDGQVIAVKVFNIQIERALKSFDVECEVLRNLRHRNLTPVISTCSNEDFRALVLEFMPNGNLENWLHSENLFLNLMERLSIMIDVACALQYLHSGYSRPVVHSDLKPSNVLLDSDMIAHVSDFGIAKILAEQSIDYTNTLATFGYIAPEYGSEGLVSTRCDVYSYGIMLMEVFTRKRPDDEMFDENLTLKDWVNQSMETALPEVIDDGLMQSFEEAHFPVILECLSTIMHVALNCAKVAPKERSDIGEVLVSLNKIRLKLSEAC